MPSRCRCAAHSYHSALYLTKEREWGHACAKEAEELRPYAKAWGRAAGMVMASRSAGFMNSDEIPRRLTSLIRHKTPFCGPYSSPCDLRAPLRTAIRTEGTPFEGRGSCGRARTNEAAVWWKKNCLADPTNRIPPPRLDSLSTKGKTTLRT